MPTPLGNDRASKFHLSTLLQSLSVAVLLQFGVLQEMRNHYHLRGLQTSLPAPGLAGGTHRDNEVGLGADNVQQREIMNSSANSHLASWCPLSGIFQRPQLHDKLIGIQEEFLSTSQSFMSATKPHQSLTPPREAS